MEITLKVFRYNPEVDQKFHYETYTIEGEETDRILDLLEHVEGPAALYLASACIGALTLVDGDRVDLTNLQRQVLHTTERIGTPKAASGRQSLVSLNPDVRVEAIEARVDGAVLDRLVERASVVLVCSDNFSTRHAVNQSCVAHRRPLVSGAATRFDGQVATFDLRSSESPCYACLFPPGDGEDELCSIMGVFAPVTGIIGAVQAEALKLAAGLDRGSSGPTGSPWRCSRRPRTHRPRARPRGRAST